MIHLGELTMLPMNNDALSIFTDIWIKTTHRKSDGYGVMEVTAGNKGIATHLCSDCCDVIHINCQYNYRIESEGCDTIHYYGSYFTVEPSSESLGDVIITSNKEEHRVYKLVDWLLDMKGILHS